jgi:cyanoexosortase A
MTHERVESATNPSPSLEAATPRVCAEVPPENPPRKIQYLALGGAMLVLVHLVMVLRYQTSAQFGITMICWYAVVTLVMQGWRGLQLTGLAFTRGTGLLLLGLTLIGVFWMSDGREKFLFVYPLMGGLGLALAASGLGGLGQYWRELTILFCLGIPRGFISEWVDLSPITAKTAAFAIWYLGQDVRLVGTEIVLPGGAVSVDKGCDGTGVISYLICLAVVFVFLFRVDGVKRVMALVWAPVLAFLTNMIRVVVLAFMEAAGRHDAFEYWHKGTGAIVWTVLPVILFGILSLFLLSGTRKPMSDAGPQKNPQG